MLVARDRHVVFDNVALLSPVELPQLLLVVTMAAPFVCGMAAIRFVARHSIYYD